MPAWNPTWNEMMTKDNDEWLSKYFPRFSFSLNLASFTVTEKRLHLKPTFIEYPHRTLSGLPTDRDVLEVVEGSAFFEILKSSMQRSYCHVMERFENKKASQRSSFRVRSYGLVSGGFVDCNATTVMTNRHLKV
jgi:hypothetical protein